MQIFSQFFLLSSYFFYFYTKSKLAHLPTCPLRTFMIFTFQLELKIQIIYYNI